MTLESSSASAKRTWLKWGGAALLLALSAILLITFTKAPRTDTIFIRASGLKYSESEIHVRVGQTVVLELFNTDGYSHAFDVDELDLHTPLPSSKTTTMTFTPTQPGMYTFYCSVYGHQAAGMVGALIVDP
jgi:plastocyanin